MTKKPEPTFSRRRLASDSELRRAARILTALKLRKIAHYDPYPKQMEFHALGSSKRERVLMAGNQLGKTLSAGNEVAYHLTGLYPDWWTGRKFVRPPRCWVANTNNETVRDNPQKILLGPEGQWGTGTVPRSCIHKPPTMSRGFPDLVDTVQVKHKNGGISICQFKAYDQGRKRWQGATLDLIWFDEEPPEDIYSEALARITATGGMVFMTMTPLLGLSDVVMMFYPEPSNEHRGLVMMDIEDARHFDEDERAMVVSGYPEHEREARSRGLPLLGSGKIFAVPQSSVECDPFPVPDHYARIGGMDFGYGDHPFAAIALAWDRDSDVLYLTHAYKEKQMVPAIHVSSVRPWSDGGLTFAWPHDGGRAWGDAGPVAEVYRNEGLRMLREHSTFREGGFSPEAAVYLLLSRMQTGRFKAFKHLDPWWHEFSTYHRLNGMIVDKNDDVISAVMKGLMMLRFARPREGTTQYAKHAISDFDPFEPRVER